MKPTFTLATLAAGLTAAAGWGAEPAPKLVPRPLPGLGVVQPLPSASPQLEPAPGLRPITPAPAASGENDTRARVLFIHRRESLPPELTANLPKPDAKADGQSEGGSGLVPARSGKVRIIPKAAVAAMLARSAEEKPATTAEP